MPATIYVILRLSSNDGCWQEDGPHQTASSGEQAIRQAIELRVENDVDPDGSYVAIPLRSWQPQKVAVERKTKVNFS